jgi:uncharacterized protein (UPF0276 family)
MVLVRECLYVDVEMELIQRGGQWRMWQRRQWVRGRGRLRGWRLRRMWQLNGDKVGLGWRGPLAAGIFMHFEEVEVIEILADDYFRSSRRVLRSLRALARDIPTLCHGVSLGLASVVPVEARRIARLAAVLEAIDPLMWSEHLAFVRGGRYEIGHLAAPARNLNTVEGAIRNLERIRLMVGQAPALENVATLIGPPDSNMTEPEWVGAIAAGSGGGLLLDLHNLYANSVNFGLDPLEQLRCFPLERVRIVHLSGGEWIHCQPAEHPVEVTRLLDDHLHDVPDAVYDLLVEVAGRCPEPLNVIIERDGRFPQFSVLIRQMRRARAAIETGRRRREIAGRKCELAGI